MTLHILKKDVRRLWPAILASLAVLASLARQDRWRLDWGSGPTESYLNLLVPVLWACLLALAVDQEPIPGDRQFWLTRPMPRGALLGAKLLFALLFVHLPALIADCYVLGAHHFSPITYAPQLLSNQIVLACALTLPAMALASLVRSFSHFVLELAAVAAAFVIFAGPYTPAMYQPDTLSSARTLPLIGIVAAAGALILAAQYFGRRVLFSRAVAIAAGIAATLTFTLLLPPAALAIRSALSPAAETPSIALDPSPRPPYSSWGPAGMIAIPVRIAGLPEGTFAVGDTVRSELIAAAGAHYAETRRLRYDPTSRETHQFRLTISEWDQRPKPWLLLIVNPRLLPALLTGPATVRGEAALSVYRYGSPIVLPVGASAAVPAGRCATRLAEDPLQNSRILVSCESPVRDNFGARVRLSSPAVSRDWKTMLFPVHAPLGPRVDWLSPLYRDVTFFNVSDRVDPFAVPRAAAADARIEITPRIPLGVAAVRYEFRSIDLQPYVVKPPNSAAAR